MHTEAHLFSVPNDCLWYDKLWGPSQRVVTLFHHHSIVITTDAFAMSIIEIGMNVIFFSQQYCLQAIIDTTVSQLLQTTCQKRQKQLPSSHPKI